MSQPEAKIPESVLVVVHTANLQVLLLQRADNSEFWQSVTGSKDHPDESWEATAWREVGEETGIQAGLLTDWELENVYEIYPRWRHRYAPGVTHNVERVFGLCVPAGVELRLAPREHLAWQWLPWRAAADACFSPSNAEVILQLPRRSAQEP
jgi:dihydroneopterin triphosphate diphosphatase